MPESGYQLCPSQERSAPQRGLPRLAVNSPRTRPHRNCGSLPEETYGLEPMTDEFIAITDLLPALRDMCGALPDQLNYRRLLVLSQSGNITPPMRRCAERFWGCHRDELSNLAERLCLAPKTAAP